MFTQMVQYVCNIFLWKGLPKSTFCPQAYHTHYTQFNIQSRIILSKNIADEKGCTMYVTLFPATTVENWSSAFGLQRWWLFMYKPEMVACMKTTDSWNQTQVRIGNSFYSCVQTLKYQILPTHYSKAILISCYVVAATNEFLVLLLVLVQLLLLATFPSLPFFPLPTFLHHFLIRSCTKPKSSTVPPSLLSKPSPQANFD